MKGSYLATGIVGILLILFGTVFALQGNGNIGGSAMSGNSFWIYAGSGVAVIGLILAILGFYLGSKNRTPASTKESASSETKETSTSSQTTK